MNGEEKHLRMLRPKPDVCQQCATKHDADEPHNQESLHWQYWFHGHYGRWPTWADAMAHCAPRIKAFWRQELERRSIDVGKALCRGCFDDPCTCHPDDCPCDPE